jgi:carbonic anhydrase
MNLKKQIALLALTALPFSIWASGGHGHNDESHNANSVGPDMQGKPSPDKVIEMLKDGNRRFFTHTVQNPNTGGIRLLQAGTENQGNHAFATILTCSDSRVPVERVFDAGIMDIFTIRVAGNVMNVSELGTIEYGVAHVRTPVVVVLGHTQCGAVTAVTNAVEGNGGQLERNIPALVEPILPAVIRAKKNSPQLSGKDLVPSGIEENVWQSIATLFLKSPVTREMMKDGRIKVVGAIYDVASGQVNWLDEEKSWMALSRAENSPYKAVDPMAHP